MYATGTYSNSAARGQSNVDNKYAKNRFLRCRHLNETQLRRIIRKLLIPPRTVKNKMMFVQNVQPTLSASTIIVVSSIDRQRCLEKSIHFLKELDCYYERICCK